jgi:glycosyltransferase involved in cell wall biosynthesis
MDSIVPTVTKTHLQSILQNLLYNFSYTEINLHGITGFLANVGDVETMSTYAIGLLQDESKLATLKQNAFEQAQKFDISNIVPVYEKLYSRFCRMDCK